MTNGMTNGQFDYIRKDSLRVLGFKKAREYVIDAYELRYISDIEAKQWLKWLFTLIR